MALDRTTDDILAELFGERQPGVAAGLQAEQVPDNGGPILSPDEPDLETQPGPGPLEDTPIEPQEIPQSGQGDPFSEATGSTGPAQGATEGTDAPEPVSLGDPATFEAFQPNDVMAETAKFSRKLPRMAGALDAPEMYAQGPEDAGEESALIQAILEALGSDGSGV